MKEQKPYALCFINEVAGYGKLYIVILLLVQMLLGISSVFYALLLRGIIDAAVSHHKDGNEATSALDADTERNVLQNIIADESR